MAVRVTQLVAQVLRSAAESAGTLVSANTTITFSGASSATNPFRHASAASAILFTPSPVGGGDIEVVASSGLIVSANGFGVNTSKYVNAQSAITISEALHAAQRYNVSAASALTFTAAGSATNGVGPQGISVSASSLIAVGTALSYAANRIFNVSAITTMNLGSGSGEVPNVHLLPTAAAGFILGSSATSNRIAHSSASTTITFSPVVTSGRSINVSATTSMAFGEGGGSNNFVHVAAIGGFSLGSSALAITGGIMAASGLVFTQRADAKVILPSGGGVPGGTQSGIRTVLMADVSGEFPNSYAETPSGLILIANGIDPMQRWDGLTGIATTAGVAPPASALELGGVDVGRITGLRVAYLRFIDQFGNVSNLSPVSNAVDFGRDGLITRIDGDVITSPGHGLATGSPVIIDEVQGLPINGTYTITAIDADTFRLNNYAAGGRWQGGGRWIYGIKTVLYGNVQATTDPKIVRRQILRNLDGNSETYYVDIDTTDLTSTAFSSSKCDEDLLSGQPVPLFTANETPQANRYGTPPSHKAVLAAHLGRIFAAGEVTYSAGNCQPLFGQTTIVGVGTNWRQSMAGRVVYMAGASRTYEIASVDEARQLITTTTTVLDSTGPFTTYAIRPAPAERKFVYFSEPALPEAWPPWNAISLPEDSDDITGLLVKGSFLYVLEKRHVYKFTFQSDPARDGFVFLTTQRGCVNNRCHVQVEDTVYLLDEIGIYAFDGQDAEPISTPIQTIFQQIGLGGLQVNWQADQRYWHAAHDPVRDTVRWFVAMTGFDFPRHAIAYDYRRKRFWIEEYPFAVTSSTVGTIGYRRSIAGIEGRRVVCLGEGSLDAVDAGNGLLGSVTSAGPLSLTDSSAPFPLNLAGAPVSIASGKGFGQQRRIVSNTPSTLTVDRPWLARPDNSSTYQIGGINWTWQSGWFRLADDDEENSRNVELTFQPTRNQATISMRMYFDHSDCPRTWGRTITQDGVTITEGQPEVTVDTRTRSGYALHRLTGHRDILALGDRYVSVEVTGVQAQDIQRVYSIGINGVRQQ